MKRIVTNSTLLSVIVICMALMMKPKVHVSAFVQSNSDSTYTTFSNEIVSGYRGVDTCSHEWFTTNTSESDTIRHAEVNIISRQCVKCGKQISTINTWTTYETDNSDTL